MAGRKHHLQKMGMGGPDFNKITDPFERDFAYRSMQATPFCKHCGKVILQALEDEHGFGVDAEWEMANAAHYKCHKEWQADEEQRILKAQREAEEKRRAAEAAFDWDAYMQEQLNKRSE